MKDKRIYNRDDKIKIVIALIGAVLGIAISIMFWSTLIESLGHMFDR